MTLIYCPSCKKLIFDTDTKCPNCGLNIQQNTIVKSNGSSVFGIIALTLAILAITLPKLFITLPIVLGFIFSIIGLVKDKTKWFAGIAMFILLFFGCLDVYQTANKQLAEEQLYTVKYVVEGTRFDVSYTNKTDNLNREEGIGRWTRTITLKGNEHAYITAQNLQESDYISVEIYIDDILVESGNASGEYSIASASCYPTKKNELIK